MRTLDESLSVWTEKFQNELDAHEGRKQPPVDGIQSDTGAQIRADLAYWRFVETEPLENKEKFASLVGLAGRLYGCLMEDLNAYATRGGLTQVQVGDEEFLHTPREYLASNFGHRLETADGIASAFDFETQDRAQLARAILGVTQQQLEKGERGMFGEYNPKQYLLTELFGVAQLGGLPEEETQARALRISAQLERVLAEPLNALLVHDDEVLGRTAKHVLTTFYPGLDTATDDIRGELRKGYGLVLDVTPLGKSDNPIGVVESILLSMNMENPPEVHTFSKVPTFVADAVKVIHDYEEAK